ncbi:MAG: DUF805 domain-containing protein [Hyphomicrobiales bacterium]|jgi:uncharacterized membrane protein YhaH (DUF805 family)|nr:DUF805 domain-containing protein [Hyphomicrobiales bacterium]
MPKSIFDDLINSVIDCFNRAFDFETRSTRKEFWFFKLFQILAMLSLFFFENLGINGLIFLFSIIIIIPDLSISVRRLHDVSKSGFWLIPNIIFSVIFTMNPAFILSLMENQLNRFILLTYSLYLLYLFCKNSTEGINNFGSPR